MWTIFIRNWKTFNISLFKVMTQTISNDVDGNDQDEDEDETIAWC